MLPREEASPVHACKDDAIKRIASEKHLTRGICQVREHRRISGQLPNEPYCDSKKERFLHEDIRKLVFKQGRIDGLAAEILRSRYILKLEDNWDDEGSRGYKETTLKRATTYLRRHALWLKENFDILIDVPKVTHGPDGSIDIYWEKGNYRLLLNIPEDEEGKATFYGEDSNGLTLEGELDTNVYNQGLTVWLMNKGKI